MSKKIKPMKHIVAGMIPVGLTLLASRPKLGKSWMVFDLAISVASGRTFLDRPTEAGDVLYWALEDSEDRLQTRAHQLVGTDEIKHALDIEAVGSRITPESAYEDMEDWISEVKNPKLIIIDTLKKIRKSRNGMGQGYDQDYDFGDRLQKLAHKHGVAILLVYHTTKAVREDFIDEVQDTTGMTAVPDNVIVMRRKRGSTEAVLHMAPKDFTEAAFRVQHNQDTGRWVYLGEADGSDKNSRPELRQKVIDLLATKSVSQSPIQIANDTGIPLVSLRTYLRRMVDYGELLNPAYGQYTLSDSVREEVGLERIAPPAPEGVNIKRKHMRLKKTSSEKKPLKKLKQLVKPKSSVKDTELQRCEEKGIRPITAQKSGWTKGIDKLSDLPMMTIHKMNRSGEFLPEDYTAICEYRNAMRAGQTESHAEKTTTTDPRPTTQQANKTSQRANGSRIRPRTETLAAHINRRREINGHNDKEIPVIENFLALIQDMPDRPSKKFKKLTS